ncbi:hypothetical protein P4E87_000524 [Klebsiella variicola]|nr:hypothetical protein [Klebsiella variicola]
MRKMSSHRKVQTSQPADLMMYVTVPDRAGESLDSWRLMLQTFAAIVEDTRENLVPLGKQYTDLSKAQADIANIPDGTVFYVLSQLSDVLADEYKNIGDVLTATGKQMAAKGYTDNVINSLKSSGLIPEVMNPESGYVLAFREPVCSISLYQSPRNDDLLEQHLLSYGRIKARRD